MDDEGIQKFVMDPPVVDYFSDLVTFLRQQSLNLDGLVAEATRSEFFLFGTGFAIAETLN